MITNNHDILLDDAGGVADDNVLLADADGLAVAPDAADKDGVHELGHDDGVALAEMSSHKIVTMGNVRCTVVLLQPSLHD
jgi:hypothetical protein